MCASELLSVGKAPRHTQRAQLRLQWLYVALSALVSRWHGYSQQYATARRPLCAGICSGQLHQHAESLHSCHNCRPALINSHATQLTTVPPALPIRLKSRGLIADEI